MLKEFLVILQPLRQLSLISNSTSVSETTVSCVAQTTIISSKDAADSRGKGQTANRGNTVNYNAVNKTRNVKSGHGSMPGYDVLRICKKERQSKMM